MVSDESMDRVRGVFERIRQKSDRLRLGAVGSEKRNQVGVLPKKGWQRRNVQFIGKTILPNMFAGRGMLPTAPDFPELRSGEASVTWIGHASFLLQVGGLNILVDPNWAMWLSIFKRVRHPGLSISDLPDIDLVLITHAHPDHLHLRSLRQIANRQPIIVPKGVGSLVHKRGFGEVVEMGHWEKLNVDGVDITLTPAAHWGARFVHDTHREFGGFVVKAKDSPSIYHAGDSAMFEGFQEIGERCDIDVALLPIGAYNAPSGREVHMNPEEALDVFQTVKAKWMVPMHYGTFPLGNEPMHEPEERLMWEAGERGLLENLVIMPEGQPHVFEAATPERKLVAVH